MSKISTIFSILMLMAVAAVAQEYKPVRVGLGLGYANPSGSGAKAGVLFYLEPGYRVSDQILANLRIEGAVVARGFADAVGESVEVDVAAISSYTLNGQYYFSNNNFRPFAGLGFGMYSLAGNSISIDGGDGDTEIELEAESKFGFYPRVGFDAGHFTLSLDYNIIPESDGIKNNYLGIRIGGFIGGGRK